MFDEITYLHFISFRAVSPCPKWHVMTKLTRLFSDID